MAPYAKQATASVPVVVMVSNDPVQSGLVTSIRQSGFNITGITLIYDELAGKMLDLMKEALPEISHVAVLWNPDHADPEFRETQRAAIARGVELQSLEVRRPSDFDGAFKAAIDQRAEGLILVSSRLLLAQRQKIKEFTITNRIPAVGNWGRLGGEGWISIYVWTEDRLRLRARRYFATLLGQRFLGSNPIRRPRRVCMTMCG